MRFAARLLLSAAACAVVGSSAQAQGLGLGASVGTNVPSGKFSDQSKTGLVVNGIVELRLPAMVGLRGELFWSRSDIENAIIRNVGNSTLPSNSNVTGNVNLIGGIGNVVLNLGAGPVHPYVIGGVGLYQQRVAQDVAGSVDQFRHLTRNTSNVGYNGGVGIALGLIGVHVFAEARYHSVATEGGRTNFVPVTVGLTF
jgi:hypothetical protein